MAFIDVQFPTAISQGAQGGPSFNTLVIVTGSGIEQRIGQWTLPRYKWNVAHNLKTPKQMFQLQSFFINVQGRLNSFRYKDWADYNDTDISTGAHIGFFLDASGSNTYSGSGTMQMFKRYTNGVTTSSRKITKPVTGTITVYANGTLLTSGTDYTLDYTSGVLTILTSQTGHVMTWRGQFDVHARFDVDEMKFTQEASTVHSWGEINVVEIRD